MHLEPIAKNIARLGLGDLFVATGYVRDLFEDTQVTPELAARLGLDQEVIYAGILLAKQEGQTHDTYLEGLLSSDLAIVGKFGDSSFNFSWTMLNSPDISDENFSSWGLEYAGNISFLLPHVERIIAEQT